MANNENLKGHGFHERTPSEQREIAVSGGYASGRARRRKANFKRTLNLLLTAEIDNEEWTPFLQSLGLDSTLESAVNAAMIKKALAGNVKAYEAIARLAGQQEYSEQDVILKDLEIQRLQEELKRQKAMTEKLEAETEKIRTYINPEEDEGVEIINDVQKEETGADIRDHNSEVPEDI